MESLSIETIEQILMALPYYTILQVCQTNVQLSNICTDDRFWEDKFHLDFGQTQLLDIPEDVSWRDVYLIYSSDYTVNIQSGITSRSNLHQTYKFYNQAIGAIVDYAATRAGIFDASLPIKLSKEYYQYHRSLAVLETAKAGAEYMGMQASVELESGDVSYLLDEDIAYRDALRQLLIQHLPPVATKSTYRLKINGSSGRNNYFDLVITLTRRPRESRPIVQTSRLGKMFSRSRR